MTAEARRLADEMAMLMHGMPDGGSFEPIARLFEGYITLCREEWPALPEAELEANVVRLGLAVRERLHEIAITSGAAVGHG